MKHFAITVLGKDRPGIISGVCEILYTLDCNLADSNSALLRNEFAMIFIFSAPDQITLEKIACVLQPMSKVSNLSIFIRALGDEEFICKPEDISNNYYRLSIKSADCKGLVYCISKALADAGINIRNLRSYLQSRGTVPYYNMEMEVEIFSKLGKKYLEEILRSVLDETGVDISITEILK